MARVCGVVAQRTCSPLVTIKRGEQLQLATLLAKPHLLLGLPLDHPRSGHVLLAEPSFQAVSSLLLQIRIAALVVVPLRK